MTEEEAVAALDDLTASGRGDAEIIHVEADAILLKHVSPAVREAYKRLEKRLGGFWYA